MPPSARELTVPARLCDSSGRLDPRAVGWARRPIIEADLAAGWPRRKRWHHWCVTSSAEIVALTFADLDYLGMATVVVIDRISGQTVRRARAVPLGWRVPLPSNAQTGDLAVSSLGLTLEFHAAEGGVRLAARARDVAVDIEVTRPPTHESLTVAVPWSDSRFQLTTKENTLPASGTLVIGESSRALAPGAFATQDFGRGVWPYRTSWNWASASGIGNGRAIGLNLGARWTDGTGLDENALTIAGRIQPIEGGVRFAFDKGRPEAPWTIRGPEVDLRFTPVERQRLIAPLGLVAANLTLCFGHFSGRAGTETITDLFGWAEEFHARW